MLQKLRAYATQIFESLKKHLCITILTMLSEMTNKYKHEENLSKTSVLLMVCSRKLAKAYFSMYLLVAFVVIKVENLQKKRNSRNIWT